MESIIASLNDELPPIRRQAIVLTHATQVSIGAQGNISIFVLQFSQYKNMAEGNMGNISI